MFRTHLRGITALICITLLLPFYAHSQEKIKTTTVNLQTGQEHKIEMPATPSSGFTWIIGSPYDTTMVQLVSNVFVPGTDTTLPGKPGNDVFTFRALSKGETTVRLALRKNYSRKVARAEDFLFIISK